MYAQVVCMRVYVQGYLSQIIPVKTRTLDMKQTFSRGIKTPKLHNEKTRGVVGWRPFGKMQEGIE